MRISASPPRPRPVAHSRRPPAAALALLALLAVSCGGTVADPPAPGSTASSTHPPATAVDGAPGWGTGPGSAPEARRGELKTRTVLSGELVAEDAVALVTPNANIWPAQIRWLVEDGTEVAEGDVVVEFDNSQLASGLANLDTQLVEAGNRLLSLKTQVDVDRATAALELEEKRAAFEKAELDADIPAEIVSEQDFRRRLLDLEKARLEMEAAERDMEIRRGASDAELGVQQIEVDKAALAVRRAQDALELLTLRAPRGGIVLTSVNRQEGRPFQSGDGAQPGTTVAKLPDLSTLYVEARLFDVDDGRVEAGQRVIASLDAVPGETFEGRIRDVDEIAEVMSRLGNRRAFRVQVDVQGLDPERLRPGMSVQLTVLGEEESGVLVPRTSLDWPETVTEAPRVVLADGTSVEVDLGPCDAWSCLVRGGVEPGTRLAPARGRRGGP